MAGRTVKRCEWAEGSDLMSEYHDVEWGVPVHDDRLLFEHLVLDGAQAGLSWLTILKKRENYRRSFSGFDPAAVARYTDKDMTRLLADPGIVRNRLKVASAIENARRFLEVQREFGTFDRYIWGFTGHKTIRNARRKMSDLPTSSRESDEMSRDMKRRGFKFVGTTILYAFMQASGMVNDHTVDCFRYKAVARMK